MAGLKELLLSEQKRLIKIMEMTKKRLEHVPDGILRLSKSHNHIQYYWRREGKGSGTYITKDNMELAKQLAQKSYDEKVLRLVSKRVCQIEEILRDYEEDEIERIYLNEHAARQKLIDPTEPVWKQKITQWKTAGYEAKDFPEGFPVILTEKGERVRSKSEKILADYFFHHNIEYKYECPLYLKGIGTIYPDFTFLSRKSGEEIYWEHNGKVDEPVYARSMVKKINAYENNGIFVGERLILTYETEQTILNTGKIEQMVNRFI